VSKKVFAHMQSAMLKTEMLFAHLRRRPKPNSWSTGRVMCRLSVLGLAFTPCICA
jgi:hypothetical protein